MARPSKRDALLDVAQRIVAERGARALTLDALAAEAGVSKGGVLYHFESRETLLGGMVDRLMAGFDADLPSPSEAGFLRAYVERTTRDRGSERGAASALVVALAESPGLLQPVHAAMKRWAGRVAKSVSDPALAHVVMMAADGLWYSEVFGMPPLNRRERSALIGRLLRLASTAETGKEGQS
jgi:AcrR family transcriptional regulator